MALGDRGDFVGEYNQFLKPVFAISVAPNIYRLTGITSNMLEDGMNFEEAMNDFSDWCRDVSGESVYEIYAWSDNDLIQLQKETLLKEKTHFFDRTFMNVWHNFQYTFSELVGLNNAMSLDKAVQALDIDFVGSQHDALNDAKNTARLYQLTQNKEEFERAMKPIREIMTPDEPLSTQMGSVINMDMFDFS